MSGIRADDPRAACSALIPPAPLSCDFNPASSLLLLFFYSSISTMAASASALLKSRVRRPSMLNKIAKTSDLIELFPSGAYVGWSGFTGVGYPK